MSLGGADGDRTHDLQIANLALSQLSYCPKAQNRTAKTMAEREGFEPSERITSFAGLANLWFKPLTHLSRCCFIVKT